MPNTFVAATWNMGGGEHPGPTDEQVERVHRRIKRAGASIILGQEVQEKHDRNFLRELGFDLYRAKPECIVAWDPEAWTLLSAHDEVLNPENPFFRKNGSPPVYQHACRVILGDAEGRTVEVLSYHTPSHVQVAHKPKNRIAALRECMDRMTAIAKRSKATACLFGGDDNVDEQAGAFGPWDFMKRAATGLRLIIAPKNTLGRRKVDDFRIKGLRPVGKGLVIHGPTDHNAHVQKFRFTR